MTMINHSFRRAYTMLELLLALVIISILMASLIFFSRAFMTTANTFSKDISSELATRSFIDGFTYDVSQAGFSPKGSILNPSLVAEPGNLPIFLVNDVSGNVNSIRISYDSYNYSINSHFDRREYVTYSVEPMIGNKVSFAKGIFVDRAFRTSSSGSVASPTKIFGVKQLAIGLVKSFTCSEKKVAGITKGLSCRLEIYMDADINSKVLTYDFQSNSEQLF
jgi:prepilin-type N-terminal cleavage/methylation domain-containing protein